MKLSILFLYFLFVLNLYVFSTNNNTKTWKNLKKAIELGSTQYINKENEELTENAVLVIKIMSFSKEKGEFSISYILNDDDYNKVNASNYLELNNQLILIRTDAFKTSFTLKSGLPLVNDNIKDKAFRILAGPNISILSEHESVMIFSYKGKKLTSKYYDRDFMAEKKYKYSNDKR